MQTKGMTAIVVGVEENLRLAIFAGNHGIDGNDARKIVLRDVIGKLLEVLGHGFNRDDLSFIADNSGSQH